ncbi:hypothetical protein ACQ31_gp165 [Salmonella phage STML-198]|uniref:Uncharacterized protein n=1 Tax=Salmonella phage STML-198 TaxID=1204531 RepID=K4I2T2_9CAUD|nr:hypothetical protein ACQ31_gp165 [Salmonella phage STML-198]AFU64048.1 hypothetical protein [Salmonella phage STML-198]
MSIITHSKLGETKVINNHGEIITLFLKFIPSIDEVGISEFDTDHCTAWVDLLKTDVDNIQEIENEFGWFEIGQVEFLLSKIKEWAV